MDKRKGRPKGEHRTMISARLNDSNIEKLKTMKDVYGIRKSQFINDAITDYFNQFLKKHIQNIMESLYDDDN